MGTAMAPRDNLAAPENDLFLDVMQQFTDLQLYRNTFAGQWEETAEILWPTARNTFFFGNYNWPGQKKTDRQVDAKGMMALIRFGAIMDSMLTPRNAFWHTLRSPDPYIQKNRRVRLYFEEVTRVLFQYRYAPIGNFSSQNQNVYISLGAFGNGSIFVDKPQGPEVFKGLRYRSTPLGEVFIIENHQGLVDGYIRWFRLTARQAKLQFPDTFPEQLQSALEANSSTPFNFLQRVMPRADYTRGRLDNRGKLYHSVYVCLESRTVLEEGGYSSMPMPFTRYMQAPGEQYGRGPGQFLLPALKTKNAQKRTFLKQGHRAADPILLVNDDGLLDATLRPGAVVKGGVGPNGEEYVKPLVTGNIQISKEMMEEEGQLIDDGFLVTLFQILVETPQMTATEVIERVNEKGILLAPTIGRQMSEYLGPLIHREIDVLNEQKLLPPMPPELVEAGGEYEAFYTSPLARAMHAQEVSGFMRAVEFAINVANATGDPSVLDPYDFDAALPDIARTQAVPERWLRSVESIAAMRQGRAQQMQQQQAAQTAPALAALAKAKAAQVKSGVPQEQQIPAPAAQGAQQPGAPAQPQPPGGM